MPQPIKYADTAVPAFRSAQQLEALVEGYGATRFEKIWNERRELAAIRFALRAEPWGEVPVLLEARADAVFAILLEAAPWTPRRKYARRDTYEQKLREQAHRVAWRQLRDFTEQALLAVRTGLLRPTEAFMWGLETRDPATGERTTMGHLLERAQLAAGGVLALPAPREG